MKIIDFLRPSDVIDELYGSTAQDALAELCRPLVANGLDSQHLLETLLAREKLGSTGIGDGVAIPHGIVPGLRALRASFGRSRAGIDFSALDSKPTFLFFTLFGPEKPAGIHLTALARISQILRVPTLRESLRIAKDAAEIYQIIEGEDSKV
jgi:PTS system nitrogen regulatory IIA component